MPSVRSRPVALLFPSGSPKAMSVGLAGFPRAFFFGHAFGSLRARGFVFPLQLAKGNERRPCRPSACLFLRSFLRPAAGRRLCFSPQTRQRQSVSALPAFCVPFSSAMPLARCEPEALFFPSNSPKAISLGLAGLPRAFCRSHLRLSLSGGTKRRRIFSHRPLFSCQKQQNRLPVSFPAGGFVVYTMRIFQKIITFCFLLPAAAAYRRRTAPDGPPSCPPRRPPGCRSGSPAAAAAGQGFGPQPGPWPG